MNGAMWVAFEVRSKIYLEAPTGHYTMGSCPTLFHRFGKELVVNMDFIPTMSEIILNERKLRTARCLASYGKPVEKILMVG